jgi:ATP-dependent DNA helicase RecQ
MDLNFEQQIATSDHARDGICTLQGEFVNSSTPARKDLVFQAFLLPDNLSEGLKTPWSLQLLCILVLKKGKDIIVCTGTGYEKTLAMILPMLLTPGKIGVVISPLKLLQVLQVCQEFVQNSSWVWGLSLGWWNEKVQSSCGCHQWSYTKWW